MPIRQVGWLEQQWNSYKSQVLPTDAQIDVVIQARRAFYGGAQAFYALMLTQLDGGPDCTDADLAKVASVAVELDAFLAEVKGGRA